MAYWLLPSSPDREFLREIIERLAARYEAPVFAPHLTLAIGADSATEARRVLLGITAGAIALQTTGIDFSANFTRTLFLRFDSNPILEHLRNSLGMERVDDQPFDPHLSLLYKTLPVERQALLAASIKIPTPTVTFDEMQVVRCRLPVATSADVMSWDVVASRPLAP